MIFTREGKVVQLSSGASPTFAENALPDNLKNTETMKHVLNILHKNVSVCTSLGTAFIPQMGKIFTSLRKLYR